MKRNHNIVGILLSGIIMACSLTACTFNTFNPDEIDWTVNYNNIPISVNNSWHVGEDSKIYLDLEITNNSNKTIKCCKVAYFTYAYNSEGRVIGESDAKIGNFLVFNKNKLLHGNSTITISLPITEYNVTIHNIEVNFYVQWIDFTWFGGEWGSKSRDSNTDYGISKISAKLDIKLYTRS